MNEKQKEWLTGILLGLIISLLLAVKVMAAPLSDEELIARTIQAEAGNQSLEGKRMVAAVILNRVESEEFPDTVEGVLSQEKQFSTYKHLNETEPTWADRLAVKMEMEGRINNEVLFFRADHYGCGEPMMQVGDHYFSGMK